MQIQDKIYGNIEINQQVIIDLINSKPIQRLKNINQAGAPNFIQTIRTGNRYEHSIGVLHLSQKFNRTIEEQIACLLHDVSHTAFSHVIDFVVKDEKHEFADKKLNEIINKSEIPEILKKHNINIEKVLDKSAYPLLDNSLPDISLDRLDYFLRDGYIMKFFPKILINEILNKIKLENIGLEEVSDINNRKTSTILYFEYEDLDLASNMAVLFANFSRLLWLDPTSHGSFFLLAKSIEIALNKNIITQQDFFTDDIILMQKLKDAKDPQINNYLNRLVPNKEFIYTNKDQAEFYGPNKPRFIDPLVKTSNAEFKRVSELVISLKYFFEEFSEKYKMLGVKQL